jgi:hypothetical protein
MNSSFNFNGTANEAACRNVTKKLFHQGCETVFKNHCFVQKNVISIEKPKKFYAFSTYFYTGQALNLQMAKPVQLSLVKEKSKVLCDQNIQEHSMMEKGSEFVQNECFRSVLMTSLLEDGYGVSGEDIEITFVDKVENATVGWSLGYILTETKNFPIIPISFRPDAFYPILIVLLILFLAEIGFFLYEHCNLRKAEYSGV